MSDARSARESYLERFADGLRLPSTTRSEVLEEIGGHLDEATAELIAEGLTPEMAEREALARLGDPRELADGIRRARQTRGRLLVAVGHGVWAGFGGAFWGYLFVAGVVIVASLLTVLVVSALIQVLDLRTSGWGSPATPPLMNILFGAVAAGYAGRRIVVETSRRSDRLVADISRPIAVIGAALLAVATLFIVTIALDPATVVVLITIPIAFALGARTTRESPHPARGRIRLSSRTAAVFIGAATAGMLLWSAATGWPNETRMWQGPDLGIVGLDVSLLADNPVVSTTSSSSPGFAGDGGWEFTLEVASADGFAGWHDLRVEAWPMVGERSPTIDPAAVGPAAVGGFIEVGEAHFLGSVAVGATKEPRSFVAYATGIAPDGRRYVLAGPDGPWTSPAWVGTAWDWLTSP